MPATATNWRMSTPPEPTSICFPITCSKMPGAHAAPCPQKVCAAAALQRSCSGVTFSGWRCCGLLRLCSKAKTFLLHNTASRFTTHTHPHAHSLRPHSQHPHRTSTCTHQHKHLHSPAPAPAPACHSTHNVPHCGAPTCTSPFSNHLHCHETTGTQRRSGTQHTAVILCIDTHLCKRVLIHLSKLIEISEPTGLKL